MASLQIKMSFCYNYSLATVCAILGFNIAHKDCSAANLVFSHSRKPSTTKLAEV